MVKDMRDFVVEVFLDAEGGEYSYEAEGFTYGVWGQAKGVVDALRQVQAGLSYDNVLYPERALYWETIRVFTEYYDTHEGELANRDEDSVWVVALHYNVSEYKPAEYFPH